MVHWSLHSHSLRIFTLITRKVATKHWNLYLLFFSEYVCVIVQSSLRHGSSGASVNCWRFRHSSAGFYFFCLCRFGCLSAGFPLLCSAAFGDLSVSFRSSNKRAKTIKIGDQNSQECLPSCASNMATVCQSRCLPQVVLGHLWALGLELGRAPGRLLDVLAKRKTSKRPPRRPPDLQSPGPPTEPRNPETPKMHFKVRKMVF